MAGMLDRIAARKGQGEDPLDEIAAPRTALDQAQRGCHRPTVSKERRQPRSKRPACNLGQGRFSFRTAPDIPFGEWIPVDVRLKGAICLCWVLRLELERIESDSATEGPARPISIGRSYRVHVHR
jgi:hypothetical protein